MSKSNLDVMDEGRAGNAMSSWVWIMGGAKPITMQIAYIPFGASAPLRTYFRVPHRERMAPRGYILYRSLSDGLRVDGRNEKLASFNEKLYLMNLNHAQVGWKTALLLVYSDALHCKSRLCRCIFQHSYNLI